MIAKTLLFFSRAIQLGILISLVFSASANCYAQISIVVGSNSSHTVDKIQVKDIFSGAKLNWPNGNQIQVVDQPSASFTNQFYKKLTGHSSAQIRLQWTKLMLSGQAKAPLKARNDDEMKMALVSNSDAIGFVSTSSLDETVKEVYRIE